MKCSIIIIKFNVPEVEINCIKSVLDNPSYAKEALYHVGAAIKHKIFEQKVGLCNNVTAELLEEQGLNIDCDYNWGCEICPYREECYNIKQVLVERERIGN